MPAITAAIVRQPGAAFELVQLDLDEPRGDEVLVRLVATGLCHTDVGVATGEFPLPHLLPAVLGHEGAGVVEAVGPEVRDLAPGDPVVLTMGSCGTCRNCERDLPTYCHNSFPLNFSGGRGDGSATLKEGGERVGGGFFSQSSFATHALASSRNAIRVRPDAPLEMLGPFGCGFQTGAGAVLNTLKPKPGDSLAVFGVGSVGLAALMAGVLAECAIRIAVDIKPERLRMAETLGATHLVNAAETDPVEAIMDIVPGGVDGAVEAVGKPALVAQAFAALGGPGTVVTVGAGGPGTKLDLDVAAFTWGKSIRGCIEGESNYPVFIPWLIDRFMEGRFPVDRMISFYPFEAINEAMADSLSGAAVKPILRMAS